MTVAAIAAIGVMVAAAAVFAATRAGWLGAHFTTGRGDCATIGWLAPKGPLDRAGAKIGECLVSIAGARGGAEVSVDDLIEDPDQFATRAQQQAYLARQSALSEALSERFVTAKLRSPDGVERDVVATPDLRPASSLPLTFWAAILSGVVGLIVGAWVGVLRRGEAAARWLALGGVGLFVSATPAAVYGARELALNGDAQMVLSGLNHVGGAMLGLGVAGFLVNFPSRIGPRWALTAMSLVAGLWTAAEIAHFTPPVSQYLLNLGQMIAALAAWVAQALAARDAPRKRASVLWLGAVTVVGATAAALGTIGPLAFGAAPLMSQSYLFAFFAAFFGAVALGVGRHHMFDLGRWSYRILFYAFGAAAMMAIDMALVYGLRLERSLALIGSILVVGLAYLPARDMLWRRYATPHRPHTHELFGKAMDVAFGGSESEQERRWRELLSDLFDPLEAEIVAPDPGAPTFSDGRIEMVTPAVAGSPPLRLRHPYGGKALFADDDATLVARLVELVRRAERARDDYARGVVEERARIARDLHDDLGARLLAGAVGADPDARALSQAALKDLRSILSDLSAGTRDLDEGLANLRQETAERVADAGLTLDWPPIDERLSRHKIDPRQLKALGSSVREAVSNVIRHSGGETLAVRVGYEDGRLSLAIEDDGHGLQDGKAAAAQGGGGHGLSNMRERMHAADGDVRLRSSANGLSLDFELPLRPRAFPTRARGGASKAG